MVASSMADAAAPQVILDTTMGEIVVELEESRAFSKLLLYRLADINRLHKIKCALGRKMSLYIKHAPKTCRNFIELSRRGYYEEVRFHRVIKNFMAQTGDPTNTGRGGESIYGDKFDDELHRELKHTGAGILSMANSGPNTNGSQFFLTLAPAPWLDGKHTIFGRVCKGIEVLKRLGNVQTDKHDRPVHDVKITRAYVQDS